LSTSLRRDGSGRSERYRRGTFDVTRFDDPPVDEHLRRGGGQAMAGRELPDGVQIGGEEVPLPLHRPFKPPPRSPLHFGHLLAAPDGNNRAGTKIEE